MHSVTTWQAYNAYGGRSLYVGPGTVRVGESGAPNRSRVVSFDRPYDQRGWGAPDFMGNEFPLIFLAESLGLDVTYFTDIDLHEVPERLHTSPLSVQPGPRRVLVEHDARRRRPRRWRAG